jgi:hypothetical protein
VLLAQFCSNVDADRSHAINLFIELGPVIGQADPVAGSTLYPAEQYSSCSANGLTCGFTQCL